MKIAYTLKRANVPGEELRAEQQIVEQVQNDIKNKQSSGNAEQDLGIEPISEQDFLYNKLEI